MKVDDSISGDTQMMKSGGIYSIVCSGNGKIYVGQASCFRSRFGYHKSHLKGGTHDNSYMQRAYNKYGPESFVFGVLCVDDLNRDTLEVDFIRKLKSNKRNYGFNIEHGGLRGPQKLSNSTRIAIARANAARIWSEDARAAVSAMNTGRKHTDESRAKMSKARKGRKFTDEHRANMSKAGKGKHGLAWLGRSHTDETKRKMSEGIKAAWERRRQRNGIAA